MYAAEDKPMSLDELIEDAQRVLRDRDEADDEVLGRVPDLVLAERRLLQGRPDERLLLGRGLRRASLFRSGRGLSGRLGPLGPAGLLHGTSLPLLEQP